MIVGAILTAILVLFGIAFPSRIRLVIGALIVVWISTAIFIVFDARQTTARLARITGTAALDSTCTDNRTPLRVTFVNNNDRAVLHFTYTIEGFEPAFRVPIARDSYQPGNIRLNAGETYSACRNYSMPGTERTDPARLEWKVTVNSADFE